jgi:DNA polymerase elongation subunit (family B)
MLQNINIDKILFLDIETVPAYPDYKSVPEKFKKLWDKKAANLMNNNENTTSEELYTRAGIYSEFGKIVCISCGFISGNGIRIKSFYGDDEKIFLKEFADMLNRHYSGNDYLLCGHNAKEFDFPYIARRMLVNGIEIPDILNLAGKKPWEVQHLDTMELWKFGDYKHYTSLELLAAIFDIPTPKDDINGSDVWKVYWHDNDLERIVKYCQKDVITTIQLFRKYQGEQPIREEFITYT